MTSAQRRGLAVLLVATTVFAMAALVSGAAFLVQPIGPFPLGNLLTVLGLVGMPLAAWLYSGSRAWLRGFCVVAIALALAWYPVSIALAGNLHLSFSGNHGFTWLVITAVITLLSLSAPMVVAIVRLVDRLRGRRDD